jgi:16S rRNA (adenine1518-N6/adenine1519-N6)-dimethyltransferase
MTTTARSRRAPRGTAGGAAGGDRPRYPRARKRLGQHFLEPAWVDRLVRAIAPRPDDLVLEIGPGRGALTRALMPHVARLVCVEIDRDLARLLASSVPPHVEVVTADVLDLDLRSLFHEGRPVRVVGNLPYNVASPIVFTLIHSADEGRSISDATIMLQKEVADRLTAGPGRAAYGALAIQVARVADARTLFTLPPGAFRPPPRVSSAVVRLQFRPPAVDVGDAGVFERVVRGAFLHRRKTLANALQPVAHSFGRSVEDLVTRAGVDPRLRPEQLGLADYARLSRAVL